MKKTHLITLMIMTVLIACNSNENQKKETIPAETKQVDTTAINKQIETKELKQLFACPMHLEITGKKDDKCSKCGMKLTVPVKN